MPPSRYVPPPAPVRPVRERYATLDLETESLDELIHLLKEKGLPAESFDRLRGALDVPAADLAEAVHITPRTLRRRMQQGRLTPDESERLLRLVRLFEQAVDVLGDETRARRWMTTPLPVLGRAPFLYADTEPGACEVEQVLGRIAHGVFS